MDPGEYSRRGGVNSARPKIDRMQNLSRGFYEGDVHIFTSAVLVPIPGGFRGRRNHHVAPIPVDLMIESRHFERIPLCALAVGVS